MQWGKEETKASLGLAHGPQLLDDCRLERPQAPCVQDGNPRCPQLALPGVQAKTEEPGPMAYLIEGR